MKISKKKIKKILIIKNDKIGDMVVSSCIFREIRKNFPKAEVTVIASSVNKPLIEKNKNIDEILVLDYLSKTYERFCKRLLDYFRMSKKIKKENFDLGVDLRGSFFNIFFLLFLSRVKYKIGFYNRYISKFFLDYAYKKDRKKKHVTFQRIDLINKALNLNSKNFWPEIVTDGEDEKELKKIIAKYKLKKFIAIVPLASLENKQWHLKKFDVIIKYIKKNYPGYKILLVGNDEEKINLLRGEAPFCAPIINKNLRVLYLLFKKSSLVITHDGGPMHLAWVGKTKLIVLMPYHLTNYYGPLGKNSKVISDYVKNIKTKTVKKEIDYFLK